MERLTENKIVLIVRRTRLDDLIVRFNTEDQARFYVEHLGADFSDYQEEDRTYKAAVNELEGILSLNGRLQTVERTFLPNFIFGPKDTVVTLGQDGLVANVLKYLDGQLLIGVNPDSRRWEGVLLPFTVGDLRLILPEVFAGKRPVNRVTMARARLNNGETLWGVNDLFIGPRTHTSARYSIKIGDRVEKHSSSGIIVSTGLGSTGWMRSILAGATGIASALASEGAARGTSMVPGQGTVLPPEGAARGTSVVPVVGTLPPQGGAINPAMNTPVDRSFSWDSDYLYFSVREPWPSKTSSADITFGKLTPSTPLTLVSYMPENGIIFSDGMESDFLQFNSGSVATITVAEKKGHLVT